MTRLLTIECGKMAVRNTGYWWQVGADRLTDSLTCRGVLEGVSDLTITFPPCKVRQVSPGAWLVEPVLATGWLDTGEWIQLSFPAEPVLRDKADMVAQPVASLDNGSFVMKKDGYKALAKAMLPLARGKPSGLGLKLFIVEAVTVKGTVEW